MDQATSCAFCDRTDTMLCRRCNRFYCPEHGADLCVICLDPASALPSERLFRGTLAALLVATVLGLWFLIAPPGSPGQHAAPAETSSGSQTTLIPVTIVPGPTGTVTATPAASSTSTTR